MRRDPLFNDTSTARDINAAPGGEAFKPGGEKIESVMKLKIIFQPLSAGVFCHSVDRMERWSRGRSSCVRARSEGLQAAVGQSPQVVLLWSMVMLLKTSFRNCLMSDQAH